MVVQHNMQAINANRMLNITTGAQAKSTEKLSSGYRINRAADDAAGLSISEKMRKQIRGLDRASSNAQDGISCVQTAEGALTEVTSMLQRMNELAVQSANGTNSEDDRTAIQNEIDQLADEIDRVSETTKFNETYLLKGTGDAKTTTVESGVKATTRAGKETPFAMTEATGNIFKGTITSTLGKGTEDTVTVTYNDNLGESQTKEVKFTVGADAAETAANIAAAINDDEDLKGSFTATAEKDGTLSIESKADYYELKELNAGTNAYKVTGLAFGSAETATEAKLQTNIDVTGFGTAGKIDATGNTYALDITDLKAGDTVTIDGTTYTFDPDKANDTSKNTNSFSTAQELLDRLGSDYDVSASLTYQATVTTGTYASVVGAGSNSTAATVSVVTNSETITSSDAINKSSKLAVSALSSDASAYSSGNGNVAPTNSTYPTANLSASSALSPSAGSYMNPDTTASSAMRIALKITKKTAPEETKTTTTKDPLSLNFHVGADSASDNKINVKIESMDATTLGVRNSAGKALDLSTEEGATAAIDTITEALKKVSAQRSSLGAVQNRLEHTIANLDNVVENTTSAESAIRDTDMAEEMVQFSKNNILAQAGQSMLAQANQSTQGVLSLLG